MAKNKTRWDALSMRDRASLIKLYSQAGIRNLDDIRAHYNKFGEGGDTESEDYNTKLEKYSKIQSDYKNADIARDNANNALWDFSRHYKGDRVYWYWTDKGKRLKKEREDADLRFWDAKKELDAARNEIGNATLDEFTDTAYDPMYFWNFVARDRDKARKYYVEHGIRQSEKAQDVIDFFNSYGTSEGFNRIRENQKNWWLKRHPYRKIWQFGPKTALNATNWLQDRMSGLNNGTANGIYDLDTYTETSVMRSGNGHGAITVGTIESPEWPYLFALPHEIAHITNTAGFATPTGSAQAEALEQNINTQEGHDSRPSEKHSDIEALRYMLFKEGIYDSRGNEDATAEDIKKLREKYPKIRPLLQMDDEQAAWMINHVADANDKTDMSNIAANGGPLINMFYTGGDTDDYLWYNPQFDATPSDELQSQVEAALVTKKLSKNEDNKTVEGFVKGLKKGLKSAARGLKNVGRKVTDSEARLAESYSSKEYTFEEAYKDARSKGQKTFFWNGNYYNTDYEGKHGRQYKQDVASGKAAAFQAAYPGFTNPELRKEKQEELDTYGITNEQTQNKSFLHERALNNLDFYGDYDWKQAVDALVLNNDQRVESDTSPNNLTHYQQLRYYLGYPLLKQDTGRARNDNGYGAPVKISAFRPTSGMNSTPYYYTFLRNPYGNEGLAAGPVRERYDRLIKESENYLKEDFYKDAEKYGLDYAIQVADKNTKRWDNYFDKHVDDLVTFTKLENFIPATYRGRFESRDFGNVSGLGNFTQYGTPEYRSFYDLWDIGLGQGNKTLTFGLGRPFEYYDRRYHDDETKQNIPNPDIDSLYSNFDYSSGGPIHIKPENRGKFTALKKRTGKTASWFKTHGTPAQKKMATFALNAAKWHKK